MKVKKEEMKTTLNQSYTQTLTKSTTVSDMFNRDILHTIANKEGILKKRVIDAKQSQLVISISASNLRDTSLNLMNPNANSNANGNQYRTEPKVNLHPVTQKKRRTDDLSTTGTKLIELIGLIQKDDVGRISGQCKSIWSCVELHLVNKNINSCDFIKAVIHTSWVFFAFSIIICFDIANNIDTIDKDTIFDNDTIDKDTIDTDDDTNEKEYLNQLQNALSMHSKIIQLIEFYYSAPSLEIKDKMKINNSIRNLTSSICSIHKTCLKYYLPQKGNENEIVSLWKKIPKVSLTAINDLFNHIQSLYLPLTHRTSSEESISNSLTCPIITLPKEGTKNYTLVLDLDETLIHCFSDVKDQSKGTITFRPGLIQFLDNVFPYYELVLFTMGLPEYANPIIDKIEQDRKYFQHRLFREHTTVHNNYRIKDLRCLDRDMNSIILIDDKKSNFTLQKENGILINPYVTQDPNDVALIELIPILIAIARENMDVREGIVVYKELLFQNVTCSYKSKL